MHFKCTLFSNDTYFLIQVLNRCYEEFGLLVPNHQLSKMNSVQDVIHFYTSSRPKDTRTFKSINMDNLPPNLNIGGKVPWKSVSPWHRVYKFFDKKLAVYSILSFTCFTLCQGNNKCKYDVYNVDVK